MSNIAQFSVRAKVRDQWEIATGRWFPNIKIPLPWISQGYDSKTHRYNEGYFNRIYELELNAFNEIQGLPPIRTQSGGKGVESISHVHVAEVNIPDTVVSYDWRITNQNGSFDREVNTPVWWFDQDGTKYVSGEPYKLTIEVPRPDVYDIQLHVRLKDGDGPTHQEVFRLRDHLIVSIGDSYASGEGNPDYPGKPKGFDVNVSVKPKKGWEWVLVVLPPVYATYKVTEIGYKVTKEAIDWGWDYLKRKFTTLTLAAEATIEMDPEPIWLEERAHRSLQAGPARAAQLVENHHEGDLATYVSFARSGAEIENGLFGPRTDDGSPVDGWIGNIGQLDEVRELCERIKPRAVDALVISIGGNDVGFSGLLQDLLEKDNPLLPLRWPPKVDLDKVINDASRGEVRRQFENNLEKLSDEFDKLEKEINELNVREVYITEYPTAHFERLHDGQPVVGEGCGVFSSYFDVDIDRTDAQLFKEAGERLNELIRQKSLENGWVYVSGVAEGFAGHGYCAGKDSYFVGAEESLVIQGDTRGTLHPNARGHSIYARQINSALQEHMLEKSRPRLTRAPTPVVSQMAPMSMGTLSEGALLKGSDPEVYVIENGNRRWIPDPATFEAIGYSWQDILTIPDSEIEKITLGEPLPTLPSPERTSISLVQLAPSTLWETGVSDPSNQDLSAVESIPWDGSADDRRGFARYDIVTMEDDSEQRALRMHPKWTSHGMVRGRSPWIPIPENATFEAQIGFLSGAVGTDGATFQVYERHESGPERVNVENLVVDQFKRYDGHLDSIHANLEHLSGKEVEIDLRVDAGEGSGRDWAAWIDPQIVSNS